MRTGARFGRPLSPLSLALLRTLQGHPDFATFRRHVEDLSAKYTHTQITERTRQLLEGGHVTEPGTPRHGWLTPKGRAALERQRS